ncbi:MAG: AMP-binding protein [Planctomycetota bacterium]|nr:AMP-binding protein [Planctomycetota bacterium]
MARKGRWHPRGALSRNWAQPDRAQLEQHQMSLLRRQLRQQILPFHPHYREALADLDIESLQGYDDMAKIPFSSKSDVAPTEDIPDRPKNFVLQPDQDSIRKVITPFQKAGMMWTAMRHGKEEVKRRLGTEYRPVQAFFTTGRTALPTSFFLSRYDLDILHECGRRMGEVIGVGSPEDRMVSVFPYAPHLAFWQVHGVGLANEVFTLHTGGGRAMGTVGILRALEKMRPSHLTGIPGYVYHLIRQGMEEGRDLSSIELVFLGGDRVTPGYREKLASMLKEIGSKDPLVISVFGFTESRKCWIECSGGVETGFHSYPDLDLFEIVDPVTGERLPDGETGELVYTPLDGRGSIVMRYRTGDLANGGMTHEPCPACGRTVPRFSSDLSRASNKTDMSLTKIKGALVNLNVISDLLTDSPVVDEWQVVLSKRNDDPLDVDEMRIAVSVVEGQQKDNIDELLASQIQNASEVRPSHMELLDREEMLQRLGMETQLKEKRIVDLRKQVPSEESGDSSR